tara:strand:- start:233 stop:979 length:747 start_codon:yes stop_codon:yes gene_type:complete
MPNLPFHIATAHKIADVLGDKYVQKDMIGYCLFGSTVPDIRAMTKNSRAQTHFTELTVTDIGTGAKNMFDSYPELIMESNDAPMKAFMCGYISHLICDETWITRMYRPHFSQEHRSCTEIESNLWDRALQLELDRDSLSLIEQNGLLEPFPMDLNGIELAFVSENELCDWQEWVMKLSGRGFSWDRLYNAMNRMHRDDSSVSTMVDDFIIDIESNLDIIHDYLETDILSWYLDNTVSVSVETIKRYIK